MLACGERVGPYEVLSLLGSGGMGEVYRARDTRLGREVALKVLPAAFASDAGRLRRFEQEARAATALNHPNITTVYDVAPVGESHYIAMELVDGKTLRRILSSGALSIKKAVQIATQLADGLAKAHEAQIVHRDLKPENVMVSKDGFVKILDFGLAKLAAAAPIEPSAETVSTQDGTSPGTVVGTVGYMSPEQARGDPVAAAADQFSFGAIVYEMLTGNRAFAGGSNAEVLSTILRDEPPPIASLNPSVPAPLVWIVERCLSKAAEDRYDSTRDLAKDLKRVEERDLRDSSVTTPAVETAPQQTRRSVWALALSIMVAAALGLAYWPRRATAPLDPEFRRLTFRRGVVARALFAPHSNSILYTASWDGEPSRTFVTLPGTPSADRSLDAEVQTPMGFRDDGSQALVLLGTSWPRIAMRGTLAWWPVLGGKPRPILEESGWADWGERSRLLAVVREVEGERALEIRDADGRFLRTLFRTPGAVSFVRFSPDEREVAFIHHASITDNSGEVRTIGVDGSRSRSLTPRYGRCFGLDWNAARGEVWFTASGEGRSDTGLWAVKGDGAPRLLHVLPEPFVLESVSDTGDRSLLVSDLQRTGLVIRDRARPPIDFSWLSWTLVADISPDESSVLFFDVGATEATSGAWVRSRAGGDALSLGKLVPGRFSPDGRWIVGTRDDANGTSQLALVPVGSGSAVQLTHDASSSWFPSFADSATILFVRSAEGGNEVRRVATDGSGEISLGARQCSYPAASPRLDEFLCLGGPRDGTIFVYPMSGSAAGSEVIGRKLFEHPAGDRFCYARWSARGDRVFAVTSDRELLTLDARSGAMLSSELLPLPGAGTYATLFGAAVNGDGSLQAYSVASFASDLYQLTGIQ